MRWHLLGFTLLAACGSGGVAHIVETPAPTVDPTTSYVPPTDQSNFIDNSIRTSRSGVLTDIASTVWMADNAHNSGFGTWSYSGGVFSFDKPTLSSCASGTPPNCTQIGFGTNGYKTVDLNFFPNGTDFVTTWIKLQRITMRVRHEAATPLSSTGDCGVAFGFGAPSPAHATAPNMPLNLTLPGRTAGVNDHADFFRILFRNSTSGGDSINIDAPINNPAIGSPYDLAKWAATTTPSWVLQTGTRIGSHGEALVYDLDLAFDHSQRHLTITVTPVSSTVSTALQAQSVVSFQMCVSSAWINAKASSKTNACQQKHFGES